MTTASEECETKPNHTVGLTTRYYRVVLTWVRDQAVFAEYRERIAPIAKAHGEVEERVITPEAIYAEGIDLPTSVNVLSYDARDTFAALTRDPHFVEAHALHAQAVKTVSIEGLGSAGVNANQLQIAARKYLVEIATLKAGRDGYQAYEAAASSIMRKYGYRVEWLVEADASAGLPFKPDLVKVAYFETAAGMERMHRDPDHPSLEQQYPSIVAQSVWLVGGAHGAAPCPDEEEFGIAFG